MVMSLIFGYTYFVITKKQGFGFSAGITSLIGLLYAYFYVLLRLQDIALLAGSIGLFAIIATIMYLTRNVNWYNESN
jgi:inner membrane protein